MNEDTYGDDSEISSVAKHIIKKFGVKTLININDLYRDNDKAFDKDKNVTSSNVFKVSDQDNYDSMKRDRYVNLPDPSKTPKYINLTSSGDSPLADEPDK